MKFCVQIWKFDAAAPIFLIKGQIISKGLFGVLEFSQKTNKQIHSIIFGENLRIPKRPFEITWPLANNDFQSHLLPSKRI